MTTPEYISPELQAKIDALQDENLRTNILRVFTGPGKRTLSREKVFDNMVQNHAEVMAQRAQWRQWRDDEVQAFVEYFKQELPEDYVEYLRQEREYNAIESELSWRVRRLADKWIPDLTYSDNGNLISKSRDHIQAMLRVMQGKEP